MGDRATVIAGVFAPTAAAADTCRADLEAAGVADVAAAGAAAGAAGDADMRRICLPLVLAFTVQSVVLALAETITGPARALDGDTLEIGGTKVRLHGIDAPETAQTCKTAAGKSYPCGEVATRRLREMTDGRALSCKGDERDQYGRMLAVCSADGKPINSELVRQGLAWAFVRYSRDYVDAEVEARQAKRGVFAAENMPPWDFRSGRWSEAAKSDALKGCAIKGNINRQGERIYHMPWQRDYARVRMDKGLGERWFCDEAEAGKAGWRKAAR